VYFGYSVSVNNAGNLVLIGAAYDDIAASNAIMLGAAFLLQKITAFDAQSSDFFGYSVE
jgi:hypothetical protein